MKKTLILLCSIVFMINSITAHAQTRQADSLELVLFYNNHCSGCSLNWNFTQSMNSWAGVTLTGGRVTQLDASNQGLTGALIDYELTSLGILILVNNQLTGNIPDFSNLPNLTQLWLYDNQLNRTIPNFSNLPNLRGLYLQNNQLTGNIPNFSNLPVLQDLNLNSNQLIGNIPDFSNLPTLRLLNLSSNQLTGNIPNFSNLPALQDLLINGSQLIGNIPDFSNLINLTQLSLSNSLLSGNIPNFTNLPNLQNLYLASNQLTGNIPIFSNTPNLSSLHVDRNNFTFESISLSHNVLITNVSTFFYAPQDSIGTTLTSSVALGNNYTIDLVIDDTISTNIYYWYKDGLLIDSTFGVNEYTITNFQTRDAGTYTAVVINRALIRASSAQNLTLYSRPVILSAFSSATPIIPNLPDTICAGYTDTILFYRDPAYPFLSTIPRPNVTREENRIAIVTGNAAHQNAIIPINTTIGNEVFGFVPSLLPPGTNSVSIQATYTTVEISAMISSLISSTAGTKVVTLDNKPLHEMLLDGSSTNTTFCARASTVVLSSRPIGTSSINSATYSGSGVTGTTFRPSTFATSGGIGLILTSEIINSQSCLDRDTLQVLVQPDLVVDIDTAFNKIVGTYGVGGAFQAAHTYCKSNGPFAIDGFPQHSSGGAIRGTITGTGVQLAGSVYSYDPALIPLGVEADTVVYSYTDALGCMDTDTAIIKLIDAPITDINSSFNGVPYASNPTVGHTYCRDNSAFQINPQPNPSGTNILTSNISGYGISQTGNQYFYDPAAVPTTISIDTVRYTYTTNSGCDGSGTALIGLGDIPTVSITSNFGTVFCSNAPATPLIGTPTNGGTSSYSGSGTSPSTGTFTPNLAGIGNIYAYYQFTNNNGCSAVDSILLTVDQAPVATFTPPQAQYLTTAPTDQMFSQNDTLAGSYTFYGDPLIDPFGVIRPSNTTPGIKTINYIYTAANGCMATDSVDISIVINNSSTNNNNAFPFTNNDPGAPALLEACVGSSVSFDYDNFTGHPATLRMAGLQGQVLTISPPVLTLSNPTTGTISGVRGTVTFTIPTNASTGPIIFLDGNNTPIDTTNQSLVIHNPAVDFFVQTVPLCATTTSVNLFGFPSGGVFTSLNTGIISGNILDPSQLPWPTNHVDSIITRIAYEYTPSYSNGSPCLQALITTKDLTTYDNRLDRVEFATLTQQDAAAGNQFLSIDTSLSNMVTLTNPDIFCNSNPNAAIVPCFPHSFSGTFVDQNNNFLSPIAGGRNLVRLEYNNNGCIGSATGFVDILGALVIYNLPDTMCRSSSATFERDPALTFLDTTTLVSGNTRRVITNQLLATYPSNPSHQIAISSINTAPGQESFFFIAGALPQNVIQVIVNMQYQNLTTLTDPLGVVTTVLADTFIIKDTVNIIQGFTTLTVGNLKTAYCANEQGDTLFPSLGFLGPNNNNLYLLHNRPGGLDTIYLVNNLLDPNTLYSSLVPAGGRDLMLTLAYEASYYGCPNQIPVNDRPVITITMPQNPNYTSQSPYCQGDPPDTLQRVGLIAGASESFSGSPAINAATGLFVPRLAGIGNNLITYTLTDTNNCAYSFIDTILVNVGPTVELTLDGSPTLDVFCYDNNNVNIGVNIPTPPNPISSINIFGTVLTGNTFNPSAIYAAGDTNTIIWVEVRDQFSCLSTDTAYITVVHPPAIDIDSAFNFVPSAYGINNLDTTEHTYCRSSNIFVINGTPSYTTGAGAGNPFNSITGKGVTISGLNYNYNPGAVTLSNVEADTVIFYYEDITGCTNTDTAIIKLDSTPTVTLSGLPSTTLCANSNNVQLIGFPTSTTGQGIFRGPGVDSTTGIFTPALAGVGTHILSYHYTGVSGCPNSASVTVNILNPLVALSGGYAFRYCTNAPDDTLYSNNDTINGTYQFSGNIIVPGTNILRPNLPPYSSTPTAQDLYYTYTNVNGCSVSDTIGITILPQPLISINGIDSAYCANGAPRSFQVLPNNGSMINTDTAFTLGGTANSFITIDPTKSDTGYTTVTYTFTDANNCSDTISEQTYIQPVKIPNIIGLDPFYCQVSDTVPLTASLPGGYFLGSGIDSTLSGDWFFIPSRAQVGPNRIQYVLPGSITAPGQQLVCQADTVVTINVRPRLVPNLISPLNNSRFCSTDSLIRFVYDTITPSVIHTFNDTSSLVSLIGYSRQDTLGVNRDTIVITSDTAFHLDPGNATDIANFVNYVVQDTVTGCKDSIALTYVVDEFIPISFQLDSSFCEADDSTILIATPVDGVFTRDGDTIRPTTPGAPLYFYHTRQDSVGVPLTYTIQDTVTYFYQNGACISEKTQIVDLHPVFNISFQIDSANITNNNSNTFCLGGDTVHLITATTGGTFSGTGVRTGTSFFVPDLAEAGIHPITLEYTDSITGCYSSFVETFYVYGVPTLDFDVQGGCQFDSINFIPNNAILNLDNLFQNNYVDSVTQVIWKVSDSVALIGNGLRDSIDPIGYRYNSPGVYLTQLIVANREFCIDTQTIRIVISPKISSYPYEMDFEGTTGNWFPESRDSSYRLLWEWGIDSNSAGGPNSQVNHLWATQPNASYEGGENAWVYSPCFDLSSLDRPMISLDYWSQVRISDGAVIEYQRSNGDWVPLGRVGRGVNWFDANFVPATPGDQNPTLLSSIGLNAPIGWSATSSNWKNGRYKLDGLDVDNSLVRLRIAFASNVNPLNRFLDGFSFDNVIVRNRTRNVLLETMSNSGYQNMETINNHSYQLVYNTSLEKDVILLQYHIKNVSGTSDIFNLHNPSLGDSRAFEYNLSPTGRAFIDGPDSTYITIDLSDANFEEDMLATPQFSINIDTFSHFNGVFEIKASATALDNLDSAAYRIYTVISEDSLSYPVGSNYNSEIHAVARENDQFHTIPSTNTNHTFKQEWVTGQTQAVTFSWNHTASGFINYQPTRFQAVVFIQDIDSKEIFQVATTRNISGSWVGVDPIQAQEELNELQRLNLFPNPVHDYFNLQFDHSLQHDYQWKLVNIQGVEVEQGSIPAGTDQVLVEGLDYPTGTYILLLYNDKVFVQRKVVLGRP
ncbi:MAG: leucine-rich repeat domain-containing protein [Aureispira sp.]